MGAGPTCFNREPVCVIPCSIGEPSSYGVYLLSSLQSQGPQ